MIQPPGSVDTDRRVEHSRQRHTETVMANGKVLVAGGTGVLGDVSTRSYMIRLPEYGRQPSRSNTSPRRHSRAANCICQTKGVGCGGLPSLSERVSQPPPLISPALRLSSLASICERRARALTVSPGLSARRQLDLLRRVPAVSRSAASWTNSCAFLSATCIRYAFPPVHRHVADAIAQGDLTVFHEVFRRERDRLFWTEKIIQFFLPQNSRHGLPRSPTARIMRVRQDERRSGFPFL